MQRRLPDKQNVQDALDRTNEATAKIKMSSDRAVEANAATQARVWLAVIFIVCTLVAVISVSLNRAHGTQGRDTSGAEEFGSSIDQPTLDSASLQKLHDIQVELTNGCTPPDHFMYSLGLNTTALSLAQAQAAWDNITGYLRPDISTPSVGCLFFGLNIAEARSGLRIGPVDLCHGMIGAAMTVFQLVQDRNMPPDVLNTLYDAISNAYPLNLFWRFMPGPAGTFIAPDFPLRQTIALTVYSYFLQFNQVSNHSIDIRTIATDLCNPFFAADKPAHYQSELMPYLGFPFLGTIYRKAHTTFGNNVVEAIGRLDPLNFTSVQQVYVIGDVLDDDPAAAMLLKTFFGNVAVNIAPGVGVTERFGDIEADITPDLSPTTLIGIPVALIGRYTEDMTAYKSAVVNPRDVYIMLTNKDPDGLLTDEISLDILRSAYSSQAISVLDTTGHHSFENSFGPDYTVQKDVAELLALLAQPNIWINTTTSTNLAPTYALANTIIQGDDPSGNLKNRVANAKRLGRGRASGFRPLSFAAQAESTYVTFSAFETASLPTRWSWTEKMPQCICPIMNQGSCGCCWALATKGMLEARMCTSGKTNKCMPISGQHVTSCAGDSEKDGCVGDHPNLAATFLATIGGLNDACFPFQNANRRTEVPCQTNCKESAEKTETLYFSTVTPPLKQISGITALKMELQNGPFEVGFSLPPDFDDFFDANPKGIYKMKPNTGTGHVVELWDYDDTTNPPHYYCKNTWGASFADNGFFRISQTSGTANLDYMVIENNGFIITPYSIKTSGSNVVPEPNNNDPDIITDGDGGVEEGKVPKEKHTKKPSANDAHADALPNILLWIIILGLIFLYH